MKRLLVLVDYQNDFSQPNGSLYVPNADKFETKLREIMTNLKKFGYDGVLILEDTHYENTYNNHVEAKLYPKHCIVGSWGHKQTIDYSLIPKGVDLYVARKAGICFWTQLISITDYVSNTKFYIKDFIRQITKKNYTDIDVCGVAMNICVKKFISKIVFFENFKVRLLSDFTVGIDTGAGDSDVNPHVCFAEYIKLNKLSIV